MKKLLLILITPIIIILGTPTLLAFIMYEGDAEDLMPTYLYTEDANATAMVNEELKLAVDNFQEGVTPDMVFRLHQDVINTAIFENIRTNINSNYMPTDDCTDSACAYIIDSPLQIQGADLQFKWIGLWVNIEQDRFIVNMYIEVTLNDGMTYKTNIKSHFLLKDLSDRYELEFDKIVVGRLPIPKSAFSSAMGMLESNSDFDADTMMGDLLIGDLNMNEFKFTIYKDEFVNKLTTEESVDASSKLAGELVRIIFDNNLLYFDVKDKEFMVTAEASKISAPGQELPSYLYDMHDYTVVDGQKVYGDFNPELLDLQSYMEDRFTEFVFNKALTSDTPFTISEETFNKILYDESDGFKKQTVNISDDEKINFSLDGMWFEFHNDNVLIKQLYDIAGVKSLVTLSASTTSTANETTFTIDSLTIGQTPDKLESQYVTVKNLDKFKEILADMDSTKLGHFNDAGDFVITNDELTKLFQEGSTSSIKINSFTISEGQISLDITSDAYQTVLDSFSTELNKVVTSDDILNDLSSVLDTNTEGNEKELYNVVEQIHNKLADSDDSTTVDEADIKQMFDLYTSLDNDTKDSFYETFKEGIDSNVLTEFENQFTK